MYSQTREDLSPYREAGTGSLLQQQNLLGLNGQNAADAAMSTYQTIARLSVAGVGGPARRGCRRGCQGPDAIRRE